jgi:hypothetical protein
LLRDGPDGKNEAKARFLTGAAQKLRAAAQKLRSHEGARKAKDEVFAEFY